MAELFLEAVGARTPLSAQELGRRAQEELDATLPLRDDLAGYGALMAALDSAESVEELVGLTFQANLKINSAGGLLELERIGADRFRKELGIACPEYFGCRYLLMTSMADMGLNGGAFRVYVKRFVDIFSGSAGGLAVLAKEPGFLQDVHDTQLALFDRWVALLSAVNNSRTIRQVARSLIDLQHTQFEAAGQLLAGAVLRATGAKSKAWSALRDEDASITLRSAKSRYADLFVWADELVRISAAHMTYDIKESEIVFSPKSGKRTISHELFVDEALHGWEASVAGIFALEGVLAACGLFTPLSLDSLGVDFPRMASVLGQAVDQGSCVEVVDGGAVWNISIAAGGHASAMTVIAAMVPVAPPVVALFRARYHLDGEEFLVSGPTSTMREFGAADGPEKQLKFLKTLRTWMCNGQPAATATQVRKALAMNASETLLHDGFPGCIAPLRRLVKCARDLGDLEVAEVLTRAMAAARHREMDGVISPQDSGALVTLDGWMKEDVGAFSPILIGP